MKSWSILLLISGVLIFGLYTNPTRKEVSQIQSQAQTLENTLNELNAQLQEIERIQKESAATKETFVRRIPLKNEQESLIKDIHSLTLRHGFSADTISFTKGQNPTLKIPEMKISFSTKGNKTNLIPFLKSIESNERFLGLENLSITAMQEGTSTNVQFGVSLYAFYQQD